LPITAEDRKILDKWDARKNASTLAALAAEAEKKWAAFSGDLSGKRGFAARVDFEKSVLPEAFPDRAATLASQRGELTSAGNRTPYQDYRVFRYEPLFLYEVLTESAARDELRLYFLAWRGAALPAGDAYAENNRKASVLLKLNLLDLMSRDLELAAKGSSYQEILLDSGRNGILAELSELMNYVFVYYDLRNFPITPAASDEYIASNHYFVMGDNRYNSLDFRYATERRWVPFDASDPYSMYYPTTLDPKAIDGNNIEGIAVVRLWPFDRFGRIGHAEEVNSE
jgi:signal peptidase I